jgi:hypothetical protein
MAMAKDKRYNNVKHLISTGFIKSFREIFYTETIPKSVVARDLGMNNKRFDKVMYNVEKFGLKDLLLLASIIGIDREKLISVILKQYDMDKDKK